MLEVKNLSKQFDISSGRALRAVDNVSFTLGANQALGIVGESGSGKSTLARMIAGLLPKTSGEIVLNGESLPARYRSADFRRLGTTVQMVFQDPFGSLNPRLTVAELVGEPLHILRNPIPLILRDRVDYWLTQTGLSTRFRDRYPHELSGGQRQRVCIARALCVEPTLLVLDEPISALDVSVQAQIINLLMDLRAKLGLSMIFIGHDLAMVRHLCDKTMVMYLGAMMESGDTKDVLNTPQHPYTQALLAARPLPDPDYERRRIITLLQGEPPSPINLPTGCRFQPRCSISENKCVMEAPAIATYGKTQLSCWRAGNAIASNHIAATDTNKPVNSTAPQ